MANQALFRRPVAGPQPVAGQGAKVRRSPLAQASDGVLADKVFTGSIVGCALIVLAILALIVWQLVARSQLSWHAFGWKFFWGQDWDPVNDQYGALPFVYGTVVSSLLALLIAVPLSIGVGVFTTEMCPRWLRSPLSFTTELLAAIPSVIYGLWAIFVLVPLLRSYVQPFLAKTLGWTGLFEGPPYGIGMLAAGIILAIMIIPIISSITREVLSVVPQHQREAALALGADPHGRFAQCAGRHRGGNHSGTGARSRRNHGRDNGDWQSPRDCTISVCPWLHHGQRAGQRIQRGHRRFVPLGPHRDWLSVVPGDHRRERDGAVPGLERHPRSACEGPCLIGAPARPRSRSISGGEPPTTWQRRSVSRRSSSCWLRWSRFLPTSSSRVSDRSTWHFSPRRRSHRENSAEGWPTPLRDQSSFWRSAACSGFPWGSGREYTWPSSVATASAMRCASSRTCLTACPPLSSASLRTRWWCSARSTSRRLPAAPPSPS